MPEFFGGLSYTYGPREGQKDKYNSDMAHKEPNLIKKGGKDTTHHPTNLTCF